jgi:serine/threonine protein phosphatase PrpC
MLYLEEVVVESIYLTLLVEGVLGVARAFGDIDFKNKESLGAGAITCEPDIKIWTISDKTEFLVLACDGLWDVLSNATVANFVRKKLLKGKTPQKVCANLVKYAYTKGSKDNISAVVISFFQESHLIRNHPLIDIPLKDSTSSVPTNEPNSSTNSITNEPNDLSDSERSIGLSPETIRRSD